MKELTQCSTLVSSFEHFLGPIYTIPFLVYDSDPGVCDGINTRTNVRCEISPSTNEPNNVPSVLVVIHQNDNRFDKSCRVDKPLQILQNLEFTLCKIPTVNPQKH